MEEKVLMEKVDWGKKDQEYWRRRLYRIVIVTEQWHPVKTRKEGRNKLWGYLEGQWSRWKDQSVQRPWGRYGSGVLLGQQGGHQDKLTWAMRMLAWCQEGSKSHHKDVSSPLSQWEGLGKFWTRVRWSRPLWQCLLKVWWSRVTLLGVSCSQKTGLGLWRWM